MFHYTILLPQLCYKSFKFKALYNNFTVKLASNLLNMLEKILKKPINLFNWILFNFGMLNKVKNKFMVSKIILLQIYFLFNT